MVEVIRDREQNRLILRFQREKKETGCGSDEKRCRVRFWVFYSGNERVKGRLITVWKKIKCERVVVLYEKIGRAHV